jgi:alpha-amylase
LGGRVSLALVLHNHQPVGNFGWVIQDVYEQAYLPMLDALDRHPGIRVGLHYTGPLLSWFADNRPEALHRIRGLVDRGQAEIVGGGYYEPILAALPDRDRQGQLIRMRDELEHLFGERPRGAWLAERVWEPSLAGDLAAAGYEWTVLDDNHLRAASVPEDAMWTAFTTDDRGRRLTVFGTEQGLRYRIPFRPVDEVISYLKDRRTDDGRFVGMMGDDGEKFGAWPGTYAYCWSDEHWVDRLFDAIESNREWLATVTPSEWLSGHRPTARVYIPTSSYVEMTEWVLPPDETPVFTQLLEDARARDLQAARVLRGGFWRNYATRYREVNDLHKQMLRASDKVAAMAPGARRIRALDHLYQGQSNDCYWHGLFGGIYLVHMRMATLGHLIAAEDLADTAAAEADERGVGRGSYGARLIDTDLDAVEEIHVATHGQTVVIDLAEGAAISAWDLRASRMAVASVMRRRPEAYHQRLVAHDRRAMDAATAGDATAGDATAGDATAGDAPKTIHDMISVKEPGLAEYLHYDRHERYSGIVHLLPADGSTSLDELVHATYRDLGDFVDDEFEAGQVTDVAISARRVGRVDIDGIERALEVEKTYRYSDARLRPNLALEVALRNPGDEPVAFELAIEWNVNMLGGGHNKAAYYETSDGQRTPHDVPGDVATASTLAFGNDYEGVRIEARMEPEAHLMWYPIETISNSEGGFERVYQGSSLLFRWAVDLAPGQERTFAVRLDVEQSIDHLVEERV